MSYSTLFQLHARDLSSEAQVETRLLIRLFHDLGYDDTYILPKQSLPSLKVPSGRKQYYVVPDFLLLRENKTAKIVVEAKDPGESIQSAWGQTASYALTYNQDKDDNSKIKWLLISNGHVTSLFRHDSNNPVVTLQISDFASGAPPYVTLRSYAKFDTTEDTPTNIIPFKSIPLHELNSLFDKSHNLVWRKEKLAPTDAFFEFCKFVFLKIREDKKREDKEEESQAYELPMTTEWLKAQKATSSHPVRDILFVQLRDNLEDQIRKGKKRIFEPGETLKLSASTVSELIKTFQSINLASIDEDLNGRMFEVFLNAAVRGKELGQYFTPRPLVDFMTRIGLQRWEIFVEPPKVIDASCGTAGFLIEVMAYLTAKIRNDTRLTESEAAKLQLTIRNECLFGIEANERVSRIARINMYLHGDGGSHIFHGDGLDADPPILDDMSAERIAEVEDHRTKIKSSSYDLVLTNPPFSMAYSVQNPDEERILRQLSEASNSSPSVKSNVLFLHRYYNLLKDSGEMLIVLDDTVLNGDTHSTTRDWLLRKFILLGVHSMPYNAFFKAKANIKTSVLHLRKKASELESQGHVFMSISNNIGHNSALRDSPERNNLNDILSVYFEWRRTGRLETVVKENHDPQETLECPQQIWLVKPERISSKRLDAFYYSPDLEHSVYEIEERVKRGEIEISYGKDFHLRPRLTKDRKDELRQLEENLKYIEIGDVTRYGLVTSYTVGKLDELPTRGEYEVKEGDILFAINTSSRGTVVRVPEELDGAICTSGFLVIVPSSKEEGHLLWYSLRSEFCRKQVFYLAQTASQPELKLSAWKNEFIIPFPIGNKRTEALKQSRTFQRHLSALLDADSYRFDSPTSDSPRSG